MALSPEAKLAKKEYDKKYWLKKAREYGIEIEGREEDAIKDARRIYLEQYWERRARIK